MRSETRYLSQKSTHKRLSESKERTSNVTADSQTSRWSDVSEDMKEVSNSSQFDNLFEYKKFFEQKVNQVEITPILHRKAINWLITFCWTRNYSDQVLWYSVGYFYSYAYSRLIKKDRLTLILISAINLAIKLFSPEFVLGFEMMKSLLNNVWSTEDFRLVEGEFLELFDFDLYYPTLLSEVLKMDYSEQERAKILFLAQTLFMNSYDSAINDLILDDIVFLAKEPQSGIQLRTELMKLFKSSKFVDVLKQKYASKFNIDQFLEKLLKEKR